MSIGDLTSRLLQLILNDEKNETVMLEFHKLSSYVEKVTYIVSLFNEYKLMPMEGVPLTIEKKNDRSMNLRQSGDKCFALKTPTNLYEALEFYNESIAHAECNTENLSLCYENRSDVYFELKMYDLCLENIQSAKLNQSSVSIEKLRKHELICKYEIQNQDRNHDKIVFSPELSYRPNEKVLYIANCLELCEDKKYGRYIKTNIDLEPGKIIAIEKPFSTTLDPSKQYICCANCLSENSLNLIPCLNCTSAMFCNEKCRTEALNNFHKYECPIINYLFKTFDIIPLHALRLTMKAILAFKSTDKLMAFTQEETNKTDINAFTLNYNDMSEEQKYYPIYALETNEGKRTPEELFYFAILTAVLHYYICTYTPFKEYLKTTYDQNIFIHLLYKHLMTVAINSHSVEFNDLNENLKKKPFNKNTKLSLTSYVYGCGTYAFCSIFNHSCAPNIGRIVFNTDMVIYAYKYIKRGEQLFDNYGYLYWTIPKVTRQTELSTHYHFQCECIACNNNFPLYTDEVSEKQSDIVPHIVLKDYDIMKTSLNKKIALECMEKCCDFLTKYGSHSHPSKVAFERQKLLHRSYLILMDRIMFKLKIFAKNNK